MTRASIKKNISHVSGNIMGKNDLFRTGTCRAHIYVYRPAGVWAAVGRSWKGKFDACLPSLMSAHGGVLNYGVQVCLDAQCLVQCSPRSFQRHRKDRESPRVTVEFPSFIIFSSWVSIDIFFIPLRKSPRFVCSSACPVSYTCNRPVIVRIIYGNLQRRDEPVNLRGGVDHSDRFISELAPIVWLRSPPPAHAHSWQPVFKFVSCDHASRTRWPFDPWFSFSLTKHVPNVVKLERIGFSSIEAPVTIISNLDYSSTLSESRDRSCSWFASDSHHLIIGARELCVQSVYLIILGLASCGTQDVSQNDVSST